MNSEQGVEELVQCGRRISTEEVQLIRETVRLCAKLSRTELIATICEHLGWYTAGGGLKQDACERLLGKLEAGGLLRIPDKRRRGTATGSRVRQPALTPRTDPGEPIPCALERLGAVGLEVVEGQGKGLWNEYVQRYHPLGYKQPFGYRMRYFIRCGQGRLGCLLLSGAAKALGARDWWIGWSEGQRLQRLAWVVNLSRHLVFPWVQVPNLSSHVLGQVARRIAADWQARWGYAPVLMETFLDPRSHEGSCYQTAGWKDVGMSTGEGSVRSGESYRTTPKKIFLRPVSGEFRACCARRCGMQESSSEDHRTAGAQTAVATPQGPAAGVSRVAEGSRAEPAFPHEPSQSYQRVRNRGAGA